MTKCLENFVSQTLGFITRFCAAELRHMVNGGDTEFPENGWHGMYVFSKEPPIDRIYHTDLSLSVFKDHIIKAANDWLKQRQWMSVTWRADE